MAETAGHILIVEDERRLADILSDYLRNSGFQTSCLENGAEVVQAFRNDSHDLILLDLMLPGLDGLSVCKEIRRFSDIPIIMITAKVEELDRLLGLEIGADDYICKPFSPREVVARVKAVLRRQRASATTDPQEALFIIDNERQRISCNGQRLDLTPTEVRLLSLMVAHPGRVYSRDRLLDLCYQQEQVVADRVIDSHIKNLRKKIEKALPGREVIHAVYGTGYRYEP